MKNTDHFNIPYPETADLVSQFPDQVAKSTAELIDTFLYEQEQKQTAIDAALAGKAPVSHTHTQSQVDGLDTALAGKAPLATLNTRVPENLALRIDTSVGTRVFAGNTMIFGDLPWIDISHLLEAGWTGGVYVNRSTDLLTFRVNALTGGEGAGLTVMRAPLGLRPRIYATTARWELPTASTPAQYWRGQFSVGGALTVLAIPNSPLYGDFSVPTDAQWLTSIP